MSDLLPTVAPAHGFCVAGRGYFGYAVLTEVAANEQLSAMRDFHLARGIDEAARSGLTSAMRQYTAFVFEEYDSREAVVADVDRAIRRRDKARAYLQRAVSLGDADGLADLAYAYFEQSNGKPQLYAVDNYQAYRYAYAAPFGDRGRYRQLDWVMSQNAKSMNSRQISDACKQGKGLHDACCFKH